MSLLQLLAWFQLATTYGSGKYGANEYGGTFNFGPITLPDTGAALALGGAVFLAVAGGIAVWLVQRRRHAAAKGD